MLGGFDDTQLRHTQVIFDLSDWRDEVTINQDEDGKTRSSRVREKRKSSVLDKLNLKGFVFPTLYISIFYIQKYKAGSSGYDSKVQERGLGWM